MKTVVLAVAVTLASAAVSQGQARPDFSGTWTLDESRSESFKYWDQRRQAEPGDVVKILQTPTELMVTTTRQGRNQTIAYALDGRTTIVTDDFQAVWEKGFVFFEKRRPGLVLRRRTKSAWDGYKLVTLTMPKYVPSDPAHPPLLVLDEQFDAATMDVRRLSMDRMEMTVERIGPMRFDWGYLTDRELCCGSRLTDVYVKVPESSVPPPSRSHQ